MPDWLLACWYLSLQLLHVTAPPALALTDACQYRGYYEASTITLRSDADCGVLIHEMVHHKQFSELGNALTEEEWHWRELQASKVEWTWRMRNQ